MTKTTSKLAVDTIVQVSAPVTAVAPASHIQPSAIIITEVTATAFAAAAVLIRSGWMICPGTAPEVYGATGQSTITLVKGHPDAHATGVAEAAEAHAAAMKQIDFRRAVAAAATQMIADAAKAEKAAELAAVIAGTKAQIARLTAELTATA